MIEDHSRRLFGIVDPGCKCLRFPNLDRWWRGQEWWGRAGVGFVDGLNGVGPLPTVSRALRLGSTGSRHPARPIRLGGLTARGAMYPTGLVGSTVLSIAKASGLITAHQTRCNQTRIELDSHRPGESG